MIDQTLQEIEIIIVNDGSIDNSLQIVKDFQNKDKRIKIIDQENRGAGNARNTGMSEAKGKYLSLLDADDFFELSMLEEMYDVCEKNDADICVVPVYYTHLDVYKRQILNCMDIYRIKRVIAL